MANRKLALVAVLSLCSLSPFLVGQGCSPSAPAVDNNTGGGGNNNGGGTSPVTLVNASGTMGEGVTFAMFYPTATGRTITITCTSSNSKSNLGLNMSANTPEGGGRQYFNLLDRYGAAINEVFTSDFTLMHMILVEDYGWGSFTPR